VRGYLVPDTVQPAPLLQVCALMYTTSVHGAPASAMASSPLTCNVLAVATRPWKKSDKQNSYVDKDDDAE